MALKLLNGRQQHLLNLLPTLLHFNHPQLPGFTDYNTPQGIDHFRMAPAAEQGMRHLLRVIPKLDTHSRIATAIGGLYLMGSMGSLAQNQQSDLDVWLCLNRTISTDEHDKLSEKCQRLEQWAEQQDVELHLFIMDLDDFRNGQQRAAEGEDCGSSQHLLLLDEFYRSAIWLSGRWPRWWLIPVEQERLDPQGWWQQLLDDDLVRDDQWLDFGHVTTIPVNEFLGAAMWQLHKSLSSPYKSLLKLLLYRSYASHYPDAQPLCQDLKQQVHQGINSADRCDAYVLMLERLATMQGLSDERLDLIRRSFYYKSGMRLSRLTDRDKADNWRAKAIKQLCQQWGWNDDRLEQLDSTRDWSPQQVFRERNELVNELMGSYRQLRQFSDRYAAEVHISKEDIQRLGNKLHAAFDARPGKVVRINPGISPDMAQHHLTLVRYPGVWQLVPGYWSDIPPDRHILRQSPSLIELLAFAELNQLVGLDTRIASYPTDAISRHELKLTLNNIKAVTHEDFTDSDWLQQPHITHLRVFVNCADDPMAELTKAGIHKITDRDDVLSFTGASNNLVRSVDILSRNQWDEWQVEHLQGALALNKALQVLMPLLTLESPPSFELHCFSTTRSAQIRHRIMQLISGAIRHYRQQQAACIFRLGNSRFGLHAYKPDNSDQPAQWQTADVTDNDQLMRYLAQPRGQFSATFADACCKLPLPLNEIMAHCQPDRWQLFFQQNGATIDFYLVDEFAALTKCQLQRAELKYWLLPTIRFLLQLQQRWYSDDSGFAGLKLFELVEHQHMHPIYKSKQYDWTIHARDIPEAARDAATIELTARYDSDRQPTLYCNYEEFSVWQYGAGLYQNVCQRVVSLRKNHGTYPCYLSDLQLEDDSNRDLLLHWHRKQEQELHLNTEIGKPEPQQ